MHWTISQMMKDKQPRDRRMKRGGELRHANYGLDSGDEQRPLPSPPEFTESLSDWTNPKDWILLASTSRAGPRRYHWPQHITAVSHSNIFHKFSSFSPHVVLSSQTSTNWAFVGLVWIGAKAPSLRGIFFSRSRSASLIAKPQKAFQKMLWVIK